jgi:hypothetical protein
MNFLVYPGGPNSIFRQKWFDKFRIAAARRIRMIFRFFITGNPNYGCQKHKKAPLK